MYPEKIVNSKVYNEVVIHKIVRSRIYKNVPGDIKICNSPNGN